MNTPAVQQHDRRRFRQFQLKHVLGLTTGVAVSAAVLAPQFRQLDQERQGQVGIQALALFVVMCAALVFLLHRRNLAEKKAGLLVERFERKRSRWTQWLVASGLVMIYVATIWVNQRIADGRQRPLLPGSPIVLMIAINFVIVRIWWKLDPTGLEVCEHGLILGGFTTRRWDEISRYTWSGQPSHQLNLFLTKKFVQSFGVDASSVERLDSHLCDHL